MGCRSLQRPIYHGLASASTVHVISTDQTREPLHFGVRSCSYTTETLGGSATANDKMDDNKSFVRLRLARLREQMSFGSCPWSQVTDKPCFLSQPPKLHPRQRALANELLNRYSQLTSTRRMTQASVRSRCRPSNVSCSVRLTAASAGVLRKRSRRKRCCARS